VHFMFFSDGGAPKRRGARVNLPRYPLLSTDLARIFSALFVEIV